jgi:protein BCP1
MPSKKRKASESLAKKVDERNVVTKGISPVDTSDAAATTTTTTTTTTEPAVAVTAAAAASSSTTASLHQYPRNNDDDDNDNKTNHDNDDNNDNDDDTSSSEEEDDLILEGVMVRNHDVSDEEDYEDDDHEDEEKEDDNIRENKTEKNDTGNNGNRNDTTTASSVTNKVVGPKKSASEAQNKMSSSQPHPFASDATTTKNPPKKKKKKKRNSNDDDDDEDILNVEFTFCDMDEKYFHGIKSLLQSCCGYGSSSNSNAATIYQTHSSALADLMIDNVAIGTVVSTAMEDENEPDVFGFASILNIKTYQNHEAIQTIKHFCLQHCPHTFPSQHKQELELCLSGTTPRPVGLFVHNRMINMPMEIVYVLHEQLIQDMDWAIDQHANMDETEEERKAYDFGAFIRLAPAERDHQTKSILLYKYFDDEIFMERSEFHYVVDVVDRNLHPQSSSHHHSQQCIVVMVLTKTGHRAAMNDLKQLIHGR